MIDDGFEYTTPFPDVISGLTYTVVPHSYVTLSGQNALYLYFDCAGGTGTNAENTAYTRTVAVCQGTNNSVSAWFVTTFSGQKFNLKLVIYDANNVVSAIIDSFDCPDISPWVQTNHLCFHHICLVSSLP